MKTIKEIYLAIGSQWLDRREPAGTHKGRGRCEQAGSDRWGRDSKLERLRSAILHGTADDDHGPFRSCDFDGSDPLSFEEKWSCVNTFQPGDPADSTMVHIDGRYQSASDWLDSRWNQKMANDVVASVQPGIDAKSEIDNEAWSYAWHDA